MEVFIIAFVLFFLAIFVTIAVLYLLNLQNTLKAAAPENRKMPPANVWLLLIPLFNIYWSFVVVRKITDTIVAEYQSKGQALPTPKPTYNVGMAMAILQVISSVISIITSPDQIRQIQMASEGVMVETTQASSPLQSFGSLLGFVVLILWIVYWVQTAGYKNRMKMLPNNKPGSEIFSGL